MKLVLIADTHVPRRARDLPARVGDEAAQADVVIHASDWTAPKLLDRWRRRQRARPPAAAIRRSSPTGAATGAGGRHARTFTL